MKKITVSLVIALILLTIPHVLALSPPVRPEGGITVLTGDYSSGAITLINQDEITYRITGYQRFWVEDKSGKTVNGFNLTVFPKTISDWGPGTGVVLNYNLSCPENIKGGNYTLYLRFLAVVSGDSSYHIIQVAVPLRVIGHPLKFGVAGAYVVENPNSPYVLNGQTITVFSNVKNLGHKPVVVNASAELSQGGKNYFEDTKTVIIEPGNVLIHFQIPISYNLPEGTYRVKYTVRYPGGAFTYSKDLPVKFGVSVLAASVERSEVVPGVKNEAYLTVVSVRRIVMNLSVRAEVHNITVERREKVVVTPGTSVLRVSLPSERPGNVTAILILNYGERTVGKAEVEYKVLSPPKLGNVSYTLQGDMAKFNVVLSNPEGHPVDGRLTYNLSSGGESLYLDTITLEILPGEKTLNMKFQLPKGKNVNYSFTLSAWGRIWDRKSGVMRVPLPTPPTTTPTSTSTVSTTAEPSTSITTVIQTSTTPQEGNSVLWKVVALTGLLLVVSAATWYCLNGDTKRKKRTRSKPKRHSPLGRFKRPRKPEVKEPNGLPKR